jgi:hypothetical protein
MTLLDLPLAIAGWLGHAVSRAVRGSSRATWVVIGGLLVLTAIPIGLVATTPRPTNLSFEDMSLERIPANTSWGRLQGEMRVVVSAAGTQYELHDPSNDGRYVIVIANSPPPAGPAMITGQVSPRRSTSGNVGTIAADDPAVPPVDEPIWLYLTPAILAIVLAIGLRVGYPVVRRDPATAVSAEPLAAGGSVSGQWSGRIGGVSVTRDRPVACSIGVAPVPHLADLAEITIDVPGEARTIRIRRAAPFKRVRLRWVGGYRPAVDVHAATADVLLSFAERTDRERFLASLR